MKNKKQWCAHPGCERDMTNGSRGLCLRHRGMYGARVMRGKTTWEVLESKGFARRLLTQEEKNQLQKHPHPTYKKRKNLQFSS